MSKISMRKIIEDTHPNWGKIYNKAWKKAFDYEARFGKEDVRKEFFMDFAQLTVWQLIQFDDFLDTQNPSKNKIRKYLKLNDDDSSMMVSQLDTINRASYLTKCMFTVEHFLKSILDHFGKNTDKGYGSLVVDFLSELGIQDEQKKRILKLPAGVRNALHNNGYTKHDIEETILGSKTYVASKGDQITFAGWDNIHIIVDAMIDLLIDVIDSTKINSESHIPKKPHFIS